MPCRALRGVFAVALAAIAARSPADTLASLEDERIALFDRVAPAIVAIRSGDALAAGFAVAPGLVVTAAHAIRGASDVQVTLRDGRARRGEVIETSRDGLDLALVRVPAGPESWLELARAPDVRTGSEVLVVGHGGGALWSLATGHVSNAEPAGPDAALLALQVPLRPGASGGPVLDRVGRVIGVVVHGGTGAVTFAVTSDGVLRSLRTVAEVLRARAGAGAGVDAIADAPADDAADPPPLRAPELVFGPPDPRPLAEGRPEAPSRPQVAGRREAAGRARRAPAGAVAPAVPPADEASGVAGGGSAP